MPLLAGGGKPPSISDLYDQFELFAHKGQETLIRLNEALGFMEVTSVDANGHVKSAKVVEGMEYFVITKHVVFMWLAFAVVLGVFCWARFMSKETKGGAPKGLRNFVEPIILYVRDQIVRPNVKDPHDHHHDGDDHGHGHGHHEETHNLADKLLPFFVTLFCFFATINLLGLIPGSSTPTSSITVTGTMAGFVLIIYVVGGMVLQKPFGIGFFKNLVPACPFWLWPLLFLIELAGVIAKPFALTVRLFANMTAGHIILFSLAFLAVSGGYLIGIIPALGAVAIYGLEVFVALLQAYIFTYLSAIFIGSYLVPEH